MPRGPRKYRTPCGALMYPRGVTEPANYRHSRRSTRVPLKIAIEVLSGEQHRTCEGQTVVVNLHGALIATSMALVVGMKIVIHVLLTDKRASARVVYIAPADPLHCGVELDQPKNIWGVPLPPDDWDEMADLHASH